MILPSDVGPHVSHQNTASPACLDNYCVNHANQLHRVREVRKTARESRMRPSVGKQGWWHTHTHTPRDFTLAHTCKNSKIWTHPCRPTCSRERPSFTHRPGMSKRRTSALKCLVLMALWMGVELERHKVK